ncbi:uncharacterized protein N0V96_009421 [Colletotrichum fioriniae]|uniref:uncharacterized protein n=1 Tax=Colletotrichum fioriniae TaxID=710243 RepID=UPI0032DABDC2|nr:hypothetical protein N0V96_009421 [Colletotrichum fioriniae]
MSNYYQPQQSYGPGAGGGGGGGGGAQNLQFYPSSYSPAGAVSGHATPQQASYGYGAQPAAAGGFGGAAAFGAPPGGGVGVSGRMGEQGGLRTGWLAAFSTEGYDGEPPLLEELGVNFGHIQAKTLAVLNPFRRIDQHLMDDADLFGPLLFVLSPPRHSQYGGPVSSVGGGYPGAPDTHHDHPSRNAAGHFSSTLTFTRSSSVLGYCLLPLVATSVFGIFMPMDTPLGIVFTTMAILWCTYSASGMFCAVGRMRGMRGLVAYPLALFYVGFGIMGIFSSRGSGGSLAKAAAGLKG